MARKKLSERTGRPIKKEDPVTRISEVTTQEVLHYKCPVCGLMGKEEAIAEGPYESFTRVQIYGGSLPSPDGRMKKRRGIMDWFPKEDLTKEQRLLLIKQLKQAIILLGG